MTDPITTFLSRLRAVRLSDNERLALRERLVSYTDLHPVYGSDTSPSYTDGFFAVFASRRFARMVPALAVILVAGSAVTFAAEGSAPGDSLYALKIHVNEPVMTAFSPTASGQAQVAADIATRRIDEAVTLATRGTLTPERQAYLSKAFDERVQIAARKSDDLAARGDLSAARKVKAALAAQLAGEAQALGAVTAKDSSQSRELLRSVVATSESISGTGPSVASVVTETPDEESTAATVADASLPTDAPAEVSLMAAKSVATAPTTTPAKHPVTGRFGKVPPRAATTTFKFRLTPTSLSPTGALTPKIDVAIPNLTAQGAPTSMTQTGGGLNIK